MEESLDASLSLTQQLRHFSGGDRLIAEAVLRQVLPELHRVAVRELSRERDADSFSPTELINEVWLRNLRKGGWQINSRQHFYAIAALAMRQVLIDDARRREAQRRGHSQTVPLDLETHVETGKHTDTASLVQLGIVMDRMEKKEPETARIIDMHYFAGFTLEEIADITGMTVHKVRSRWERGRDSLKSALLA